MRTCTAAQLRQFFAAIAEHRLAPAYLAATTGTRRGEILGLRWRDVDLEQRRLQVNQTVLSVSYEIVYGGPKTTRGKRRITLDPETIRVLTAHGAAQGQEMQLIGDRYVGASDFSGV